MVSLRLEETFKSRDLDVLDSVGWGSMLWLGTLLVFFFIFLEEAGCRHSFGSVMWKTMSSSMAAGQKGVCVITQKTPLDLGELDGFF